MTPEDPDALWRRRFVQVNLLRIGATVVVLLALALWQSDLIVRGGSPIGLPIALVALTVSFLGPRWLARRWREPPGR